MSFFDDDLTNFEAHGARPLPSPFEQGFVENDGAQIWYATFGDGNPIILLHGGLGHSGNWGYQVPELVKNGYRVIVVDSRGHGRSTRDEQPYTYELMATDVLRVMDTLRLEKVAFLGWSDGACTALILALKIPSRVAGVYFFACNMDPSGTKEFEFTPLIGRCFAKHKKDYAELSATPDKFEEFSMAVSLMQETQPNYSLEDLTQIRIPIAIVQSEHDEFVKLEHAEYLAKNIETATLILLKDVSHFAPLQRPEYFNHTVLKFFSAVFQN